MNTTSTLPLFESMTRKEIRNVAKIAGVPRGKNKGDTIQNMLKAIDQKKVFVKFVGTISVPGDEAGTFRKPIFMKPFGHITPTLKFSPTA